MNKNLLQWNVMLPEACRSYIPTYIVNEKNLNIFMKI